MKFRDPKTLKVFDNIKDALENYCPAKDERDVDACKRCVIGSSKNTDNTICTYFSVDNPTEAARLMGYDVIEDHKCYDCKNYNGNSLCGFTGVDVKIDPEEGCSIWEKKDVNMEQKEEHITEAVDHPAHYNQGGVECIDAMKAATVGLEGIQAFCAANAIKYIWRFKDKNGAEDLDKAMWYIQRLKEEIRNG